MPCACCPVYLVSFFSVVAAFVCVVEITYILGYFNIILSFDFFILEGQLIKNLRMSCSGIVFVVFGH